MKELISEAIDFIRKYEPPEGYFVGFSGGKDSIVTLDLVRRSGVNHQAFYSMTLIDPPEVMKFIRENYPDVKKLKPDMTFWQGCLKKNMPLQRQRWCCTVLKHGTKSVKEVPLYHRIYGLRAEESYNRAKRGQIDTHDWQIRYKPIFEWSSSDVWEYIKNYNLKYPSLYDEGFARLGCVCCPMDKSKFSIARKRTRWPNFYRILDKTLNTLWERQMDVLINKYLFTYEEFMSWPNWKTKEERRQLNLYPSKSEEGK